MVDIVVVVIIIPSILTVPRIVVSRILSPRDVSRSSTISRHRVSLQSGQNLLHAFFVIFAVIEDFAFGVSVSLMGECAAMFRGGETLLTVRRWEVLGQKFVVFVVLLH